MIGISRGEVSSSTNPILQFFSRKKGFLQDIVEGTFTIEDVHNPDNTPLTRVAQTTINTDAVGDGGYKLGTGRYYIPTGATSSWAYGTHRAICRYKMETGGREYIQEILFEVLNATQFLAGTQYTGYATTRDLYAEEFFSIAGLTPDKLHRHINRVSKQIENWTGRFFGPRYIDQRISGDGRPVLFLNEAIIGLEAVGTVSIADSVETFSDYSNDGFTVFNRHLDGLMNPDDRDNPKLEVARDDISGYLVRGWKWPMGDRNISIRGVFGYTDPELDSDTILIGRTPEDLTQIVGVLVSRYIGDPALDDPASWQPGRIKAYKTRDQQIQFFGSSGNVNFAGGMTGDSMLDQMLLRFMKPVNFTYAERRQSAYTEF